MKWKSLRSLLECLRFSPGHGARVHHSSQPRGASSTSSGSLPTMPTMLEMSMEKQTARKQCSSTYRIDDDSNMSNLSKRQQVACLPPDYASGTSCSRSFPKAAGIATRLRKKGTELQMQITELHNKRTDVVTFVENNSGKKQT